MNSLLKKSKNLVKLMQKRFTDFHGPDAHLKSIGITNPNVYRNLGVSQIYYLGVTSDYQHHGKPMPCVISRTGALCTYSGTWTGRKPKDKRAVLNDATKEDIWWGNINIPIK